MFSFYLKFVENRACNFLCIMYENKQTYITYKNYWQEHYRQLILFTLINKNIHRCNRTMLHKFQLIFLIFSYQLY